MDIIGLTMDQASIVSFFCGTLQNLDSGLWTGPWTGLWTQ